MNFIDIHTHNPGLEDGIFSIINLLPEENLPPADNGLYYSVGLHPWLLESSLNVQEQLMKVEELSVSGNVLAIGECGLDKLARVDMALQEMVFTQHAVIAEKVNKPLIIHNVKAYNELIMLKMRLKATVPWILHGFKGSPETAIQLRNHGFMFSFGKALVNPKPKVVLSLLQIPVELVFFETDESDMKISEIYAIASELKNCQVEELKQNVFLNFKRVFPGL